MAKIVVFMRDDFLSSERMLNAKFRKIVREFAPYIIEGNITYDEFCTNTRSFEEVFLRNPDCELVFTTENDSEAQFESCKRRYLTFEWRCFTSGKLVPVRTIKDLSYGIVSYDVDHYSVMTSL